MADRQRSLNFMPIIYVNNVVTHKYILLCKVGCVGRKTSYTVSNLEHGKVYHFNLFAVNRRTNLSFPYGRTTLKYEPRSKPAGLRDGKVSTVNLRKMDGTATFKFKVTKLNSIKWRSSVLVYSSQILYCAHVSTQASILISTWQIFGNNGSKLCLGVDGSIILKSIRLLRWELETELI